MRLAELLPIVAVPLGIGALGREDGPPPAHAVLHPQVAVLRVDAATLGREGSRAGGVDGGGHICVWMSAVVSMGLREFPSEAAGWGAGDGNVPTVAGSAAPDARSGRARKAMSWRENCMVKVGVVGVLVWFEERR